jgi:hypothetical protein
MGQKQEGKRQSTRLQTVQGPTAVSGVALRGASVVLVDSDCLHCCDVFLTTSIDRRLQLLLAYLLVLIAIMILKVVCELVVDTDDGDVAEKSDAFRLNLD